MAAPLSVTTTIAAPGASSVTLPNGATVTLVGVRDTQKRMGHSWLDDDNPATRRWGSLTSAANVPFRKLPPGAIGREFVVMTRCKLSDQPALAWDAPAGYPYYLTDGAMPAGTRAPVTGYSWQIEPRPYFAPLQEYAANPDTSDGSGMVRGVVEPAQEFRAADRTGTLRYGVAAGPWQDISEINKQVGTQSFRCADGQITATLIPDAHKVDPHDWAAGNALIKITDPFSRRFPSDSSTGSDFCNYQRVLVALDRNHAHAIYSVLCSLKRDGHGNVTQTGTIPSSVLDRADTFLLLARPFEWAEFRNVPLQPR